MLFDAIVIIAVGMVAVLLPSTGTHRTYLRRRLTQQAGATVPVEQEPALEARLTRRARGLGTGILVAGLALLILAALRERAADSAGGFFLLSVIAVGGAAGLVVADILWPGHPVEGPRTARATSPTAADYLPGWMRKLSAAVTLTGLITLGGVVLLARSEWFDAGVILRGPVPLLAVGLLAVALLSAWATHRILDAPQPARDETELYWQDAVRAQTLSSLNLTAPFLSLLALVVCGSVLDGAASAAAVASGQTGPGWSLVLLIAGYTIPVVLAIAILVFATGQGNNGEMRHFRSRLWDGRAPRPRAQETHA